MTKTELQYLVDRVRKRHNLRVLTATAILVLIIFGGFKLSSSFLPVESTQKQRDLYVFAIVFTAFVWASISLYYMLYTNKSDCYHFDVLCTKCGKPLYEAKRLILGSPSVPTTGKCPHCAANLIDGIPSEKASFP